MSIPFHWHHLFSQENFNYIVNALEGDFTCLYCLHKENFICELSQENFSGVKYDVIPLAHGNFTCQQ